MKMEKYFGKLDASCGYWNIETDEESSFDTPFGRYRFLGLPYEISCAQDTFQERMHELFRDIQGVSIYIAIFSEKAVCVPKLQERTFCVPRKILRIQVCIPRKNFTHSILRPTKKKTSYLWPVS